MDLWIRSQDKRILQKIDNIYTDANYDNKRICTECNDEIVELGTYNSKERALGVLDEIQKSLEDDVAMYDEEGYPNLLENIMIYEMPKE